MPNLVPYTPPSRDVGIVESFRLAREERQMNAGLERLTRNSALAEVAANHGAMRRSNDAVRDHVLRLQEMQLQETRVRFAAGAISRSYDHIVREVAGDPGKALYLEPLMSKCAVEITAKA